MNFMRKNFFAGMTALLCTTFLAGCQAETIRDVVQTNTVESVADSRLPEDIDGNKMEEQSYEISLDDRGNEEELQDAAVLDSVEKRMIQYGICGGDLGIGWLLYTVPDQEGQDYKIYFFNDSDQTYKPFEEIDFDLDQADFVFPDVRENNMAIGKFIEIYLCESFTSEAGGSDWIMIATYEIDGRQYYDTRIYTSAEGGYGYAVNKSRTEELNALYYDAEEYPVWQIIEMPHD